MPRVAAWLAVVAALTLPVPAIAQTASVRRPAPRPPVGFRAYGIVETENMAAPLSFNAVIGSSSIRHAGLGVEATNLWHGVFARFAFTRSSSAGDRVFVDAFRVAHSLGIPLTIEMTPIEVGAGWRFGDGRRQRIVPYAGAALLVQSYTETSTNAATSENTSTTDRGSTVFAGAEVAIRFVRVAIEGQYRNLSNAVGTAGAFQSFSETNLGGGVVRVTFGIGF